MRFVNSDLRNAHCLLWQRMSRFTKETTWLSRRAQHNEVGDSLIQCFSGVFCTENTLGTDQTFHFLVRISFTRSILIKILTLHTSG